MSEERYRNPEQGSEEIELTDDDIEIEDVTENKKVVPMFSKKGKLTLAVLAVGGLIYYLWLKKNGSVEGIAPVPVAEPVAEPTPTPEPIAEPTNTEL